MIKQGDIFIIKLDRGFYGAFRVLIVGLDKNDKTVYLIATTNYLDTRKPELSDPKLLEVFRVRDIPSIKIFTDFNGCIGTTFEYLGNKPLTKAEKRHQLVIGNGTDGGFPLAGPIQKTFGTEVLWRWRMKNEPEQLLKEREELSSKANERLKRERQEPKILMPDEEFWRIIDLLDWSKETEENIISPSVKDLAQHTIKDIKQFEENLTNKLFYLDTKNHAMNIGEGSYQDGNQFSVDLFLYARCAAISKGKQFYLRVLNDPKLMPQNETFEALLSLSNLAYQKKTGRDFTYQSSNSYETYSNKEKWK